MEREDARKKIAEERTRLEDEKDKSRRKLAMDRERLRQEAETIEEERRKVKDQVGEGAEAGGMLWSCKGGWRRGAGRGDSRGGGNVELERSGRNGGSVVGK